MIFSKSNASTAPSDISHSTRIAQVTTDARERMMILEKMKERFAHGLGKLNGVFVNAGS
jgi:hypothetical protein